MTYRIDFESNPTAEDTQILSDGIFSEAKKKKDLNPVTYFAFFIRDENAKIVGGCNGDILYGQLYVSQLWVDEKLRGQGYGTKLMRLAEDHAKQNGCSFVAVNTMDFEAPEFYKNLGFHVEFERHGFDKDSVFYFLRKDL
jgi:ribosomal protein S18 acetylase RimI-like enzyme